MLFDLVILMILILFLFGYRGSIKPILPGALNVAVLAITVGFCVWIQAYVLKHLPFKDCLPFRAGSNLVQGMQIPADAVPDSTVMSFIYEKGGKRYTFTQDQLPANLDGYKYIDRTEKIIRAGYDNEPPIKDFLLFTPAGTDTTLGVLNQPGSYYLLFRKDFDEHEGGAWVAEVARIARDANARHIPFIVVTGQRDRAEDLFNRQLQLGLPIYTCDVTAIKTAARTNPCVFSMDGPVVVQKWGYADFDHIK